MKRLQKFGKKNENNCFFGSRNTFASGLSRGLEINSAVKSNNCDRFKFIKV